MRKIEKDSGRFKVPHIREFFDESLSELWLLVLRTLVVHSLQEDALGTVQSDIPKVLEVLCTYTTVVEDAKAELLATLKPDAAPIQRGEMVKTLDVFVSSRIRYIYHAHYPLMTGLTRILLQR